MRRVVRLVVALGVASFVATGVGLDAQKKAKDLSLRLTSELAPPGAIAQVKLQITEPKPITTGRGFVSFDGFDSIEGIALGEADAAGMALVTNEGVAFTLTSPSGTLGLGEYPILMIAARVPATAVVGTSIPVSFGGELVFVDPSGATYPYHVRDGAVDVGGSLWVGDVRPGSAALGAGDVFTILGGGFDANTRVKLEETMVASVTRVDSNTLDVELGQDAVMHGLGIRVRTKSGGEVTYYSYQRTRPVGLSADAVLADVVPLFPAATFTNVSVPVGATTAGLALQNVGDVEANVAIELINAAGSPVASGSIALPPSTFAVRTIGELFGTTLAGTGRVRVTSTQPIQALGVNVEGGSVVAQLPE